MCAAWLPRIVSEEIAAIQMTEVSDESNARRASLEAAIHASFVN